MKVLLEQPPHLGKPGFNKMALAEPLGLEIGVENAAGGSGEAV